MLAAIVTYLIILIQFHRDSVNLKEYSREPRSGAGNIVEIIFHNETYFNDSWIYE